MTRLLISLLTLILLTGCTHPSHTTRKSSEQKNELKYAKRLRMYSDNGYTVAEILGEGNSPKVETTYILLPEKVSAPTSDPNVTVIPTPVHKALVYTSVHAAGLDELGKIHVIGGVADAEYFKLPAIRAGLDSGAIRDVGSSSSPSAEKIIELAPQVIMVNQYQGADYTAIDKVGIPLIKMAENLEETPLGRAEWIKLLGALVGERKKADSIFNAVESRYLELKQKGTELAGHPVVMTETMYEGVWNVPGGESYQAHLIADAGGRYPWADRKKSGSIPLSYEQVLEKAADADIWLMNIYGLSLTVDDLLKMDNRYRHFAPVNKQQVWYCDTAVKPLFEETPFHPDILLADYIAIFSGQPDNLSYYQRIK